MTDVEDKRYKELDLEWILLKEQIRETGKNGGTGRNQETVVNPINPGLLGGKGGMHDVDPDKDFRNIENFSILCCISNTGVEIKDSTECKRKERSLSGPVQRAVLPCRNSSGRKYGKYSLRPLESGREHLSSPLDSHQTRN